MKKYKLLQNDCIIVYDTKLYRIQALIDFSNVKAGQIGGYIEKEENLSHEGNSWVYDEAYVMNDAQVYGNAVIYGEAVIGGNAKVFENAVIDDNSFICGYAQIFGNAWIHGYAVIQDNSMVYGKANIYGNASIKDYAWIYDNVTIYGNAKITGNSRICGNAIIYGNAKVSNTLINGEANIGNNADICKSTDYIQIGPVDPTNGVITFFNTIDNGIAVSSNNFKGSLDEFEAAMKKLYKETSNERIYQLCIDIAKEQIYKQ